MLNAMTDSDLDAIEARAKAASGGNWRYEPPKDDGVHVPWSFCWGPSISHLGGSSKPQADADREFIAHAGGDNGDVLRLVAEVRRLNADLFDAERKAVHLAEEVGRLKAEIGGQYRDYNMKVITTDEDGNSVTVYGPLRKELEKRG